MIGPSEIDINIYQGSTFYWPFTLYDTDGDTVSLSGAEIRGKVRNDVDDAAAIVTFTGTVVSGEGGQGELTLTPALTAAIVLPASPPKKRIPTKYLWDMEVEFSNGVVIRVYQGFCYVWPEVTK